MCIRDRMEAANTAAKEARLGVWETYVEPVVVEEEEAVLPDLVHISVQHVSDGSTLWVHMLGDEGKRMLDSKAARFSQGDFGAPGIGGKYRIGQYCLAPFVDGATYRAQVLERVSADKYKVLYIDYGNTHEVALSDLEQFPADKVNVPEMAWPCKLAFLDAPALNAEYGSDAANNLERAVMGRSDLVAEIVSSNAGVLSLIVFEQQDQSPRASVNCHMLETGCVRTMSGRGARDMPDAFRDAEEKAAKRHLCLWRYGDSREDSDEDNRRPKAWNAKR
eukprot:TRINITY_DN6700_c0_g1_i3.p1 TRINITY_DN6700_c0_g1~~TRINITY_DN6700_c0_g1_i3.p1  ORF type:complete len:277 (-),score=94.16 TRINITY_DN6700_c0_g1_i3:286-1116(-)